MNQTETHYYDGKLRGLLLVDGFVNDVEKFKDSLNNSYQIESLIKIKIFKELHNFVFQELNDKLNKNDKFVLSLSISNITLILQLIINDYIKFDKSTNNPNYDPINKIYVDDIIIFMLSEIDESSK